MKCMSIFRNEVQCVYLVYNLAQATEVLFLEIDNSLCNIYGLNEARRRVLESYVVLIMTYRYEL